MNKINRLIKAIKILIVNNSSLINAISSIEGKIEIIISNAKGSYYVYESNNHWHTIECGVRCISELYLISKKVCSEYLSNSDFQQILDNTSFQNTSLHIEHFEINEDKRISPVPSEILEDSGFLSGKELSNVDKLVIFAFAYSLFHEIGHAIYNKQINNEMEREKIADQFSFEMGKALDENYNKGNNCCLYGLFIGISQMLLTRNYQEEKDDVKHPHSIERIYNLLNFWRIQNESPLWKLAYKVVCEWSTKNSIHMCWEKETSKLYKDKFIDAYMYFRKGTLE